MIRIGDAAASAVALARAGVLRPERPDRIVRLARAARQWGVTLAGAFAAAAARYDERVALVDERGTWTFAELDMRTNALARGLVAEGVRAGDTVGILVRNHRYFFDITGALAKVGAHALYLNTGFAAPQISDVMHREHATVLVHDAEFATVAHDSGIQRRYVAWPDNADNADNANGATLDALAAAHTGRAPLSRPAHEGRTIILTSGTTGTPKGAAREQGASAAPAVALLERIPYRSRETMVVAAPCFHSWGFSNALVGLLLGDTLVLQRHFDPEATLATIERHRANVLAAVPVMLARMLEVERQYDTSSLRLVPLSGSSLPGHLATRFMDRFGDVVYNLYGSTEIGYATVATPADLRAAPATAGRPPRGTELRLIDRDGRDVAAGETGRIFVKSDLTFHGYTDGQSRIVIEGFMHTGDTGHLDPSGLLFVDGRDDDMIVSGGENVFPGEVEDVLQRHPDILEAAVVGVPDEEFGQRLKAYVVRRNGSALDEAATRAYVHENLARYKVPRDVVFVTELPRNATGKVVRRQLD